MQHAEAAYEERFLKALRDCASGVWGLFGTNDRVDVPRLRSKTVPHSADAREILERGNEIAKLRSQLGFGDFSLHERFLEYRRLASDPNAPGEPHLAQQFLDEIAGDRRDNAALLGNTILDCETRGTAASVDPNDDFRIWCVGAKKLS
ncbi:MAG TPA: hypothetical protein VMG98_07960 [Verrucomicrobiae bacterium]|nr:hypothetical protein [Verrucomicrobiae bacterium]HTZ54707.1 hypothetical protein [Candidatus Acidoferrum sp.]